MSTNLQQQIDKEETEKEIKKLSDEYNANAERLNASEVKLNNAKDKSLRLLKQLYKQRKYSDPSTHSALADLERQYEESENSITEEQNGHYDLIQECFRQIQKLRLLQTNYLVAVINSLQKELSDYKENNESKLPTVQENNLV